MIPGFPDATLVVSGEGGIDTFLRPIYEAFDQDRDWILTWHEATCRYTGQEQPPDVKALCDCPKIIFSPRPIAQVVEAYRREG
jgi:hypothetical protein